MPTLFQATCLNPHRLLRQYRDNWGEYNALAVEKLDRICNLGCYVPRFYHAPSNPDELFAAGAYLSYNLRIPPGSWICNFDSMTREGLNLQITDVALNKRWFSSPIPCELLQPSSQSGGPRCNYFPAPYPVTDPGTFIVELWNRTNAQLRCQLTLAVAVPKDACA